MRLKTSGAKKKKKKNHSRPLGLTLRESKPFIPLASPGKRNPNFPPPPPSPLK